MPAPDADAVQIDRALVTAHAASDAATASVFDDELTWVDSNGRIFDKQLAANALPTPLLGDEVGCATSVRHYGEVVAVAVERGKEFVLRIWIKRAAGWRLIAYHEVSQNLPAAAHGPGRKEWDNPCYILPYEPRNADERDCLASWQQLEIAVMRHHFSGCCVKRALRRWIGSSGPPGQAGGQPLRHARQARMTLAAGWGGRDRTSACRNQNPVPYRLATPQSGLVIPASAPGFNAAGPGGGPDFREIGPVAARGAHRYKSRPRGISVPRNGIGE